MTCSQVQTFRELFDQRVFDVDVELSRVESTRLQSKQRQLVAKHHSKILSTRIKLLEVKNPTCKYVLYEYEWSIFLFGAPWPHVDARRGSGWSHPLSPGYCLDACALAHLDPPHPDTPLVKCKNTDAGQLGRCVNEVRWRWATLSYSGTVHTLFFEAFEFPKDERNTLAEGDDEIECDDPDDCDEMLRFLEFVSSQLSWFEITDRWGFGDEGTLHNFVAALIGRRGDLDRDSKVLVLEVISCKTSPKISSYKIGTIMSSIKCNRWIGNRWEGGGTPVVADRKYPKTHARCRFLGFPGERWHSGSCGDSGNSVQWWQW